MNLNGYLNDAIYLLDNSRVGFIVLVLCINSIIRRSSQTLIGAWVSNFTGVFFHELAHALVGVLTNARPKKLSLIPEKIQFADGYTCYLLGHVISGNPKWYNHVPVSMAPLVLIGIAILVEKYFWNYFQPTFLNYVLYVYLLIVFLLNSIPSPKDFSNAIKSVSGLILWFFVAVLAFNYQVIINYV